MQNLGGKQSVLWAIGKWSIGLYKGNVVLCECGKMREMGKMCHVMSIDEKVRCICL